MPDNPSYGDLNFSGEAPLRWLERETRREGLRLALAVAEGKLTRAELEEASRVTGDGEPFFALDYLDKWAAAEGRHGGS
jgi:hypothetical protein